MFSDSGGVIRSWIPLLVLAGAAAPAPALAADVVSPRDGDTVASQPVFAFDLARGSALVEVARTPDVKTAGDDIGAFVDQHAESRFTIGGEFDSAPYIFKSGYPGRLNAGRYYWHAKIDDSADDGPNEPEPAWGPVRRFTVRDEPVTFEGWAVRAERLRPEGGCATPLRLRGKVVWDDNDSRPRVRFGLALGATRMRVDFDGTAGSDEFDEIVCLRTRSSSVKALPSLRDRGGHVTTGPTRDLVLGAPLRAPKSTVLATRFCQLRVGMKPSQAARIMGSSGREEGVFRELFEGQRNWRDRAFAMTAFLDNDRIASLEFERRSGLRPPCRAERK